VIAGSRDGASHWVEAKYKDNGVWVASSEDEQFLVNVHFRSRSFILNGITTKNIRWKSFHGISMENFQW